MLKKFGKPIFQVIFITLAVRPFWFVQLTSKLIYSITNSIVNT